MTSNEPLLLTLGYGKRTIDEVIALLREHEVEYLVDVRSAPWSKYQPDFSHDALKTHLRAAGITYLYMGEELGGRPKDRSYYDEDTVNYGRLKESPAFREGIGRLRKAWDGGYRVALLCSEARPENCHRTKLIAKTLVEEGMDVVHLDEDGIVLSHDEVMERLSEGQPTLFGDLPQAARSRRKYRAGSG
jgi:uncharacterized protein (DUF488 family)